MPNPVTTTIDGREYLLLHTSWGDPYIQQVPPGWVPSGAAVPLYGLVYLSRLLARVYKNQIPGIRVCMPDRSLRWYVAPPPAGYVPPAPHPITPIGENLEGLPTHYRKALARAGCHTRADVATTPDAKLAIPWSRGKNRDTHTGLGKIGLAYIRAHIPYTPLPAAPAPEMMPCPLCHGTGFVPVSALSLMQEVY